jgi:hypothetical protein
MRGFSVIIDDEVWMSPRSVQPAINFVSILLEGDAHGTFGGLAIGPRRCGADVVLAAKTFAKFIVAAPNVFAEGVSTRGFVF